MDRKAVFEFEAPIEMDNRAHLQMNTKVSKSLKILDNFSKRALSHISVSNYVLKSLNSHISIKFHRTRKRCGAEDAEADEPPGTTTEVAAFETTTQMTTAMTMRSTMTTINTRI